MFLAGGLSYTQLVVQQFPNVELPVVRVIAPYPGASTTEMRDNVVMPIENAISGTPDLVTLDSTIEDGTASVAATFTLDSDVNTDLVYIQKAVQQAETQLPKDITPPTVVFNSPADTVALTIAVSSKTLNTSALALLLTYSVVPAIEQVPGISYVVANGLVVPSYQVTVNPQKLAAAQLTLNDVTSTITDNDNHLPGGWMYGPQRETTLDIRGDIQSVPQLANLVIQAPPVASIATTTAANSTYGPTYPWSEAPRAVRVGDVATVTRGNEIQRVFAAVNGQNGVFLQVQKASNASEITAANNVLAMLPKLRAQYPAVEFHVVNNQSDYTKEQLQSVFNTLMEGVALTALVMIFFLKSWRNAVVVMVAIPTSLCITLFVMRLMNYTLDTISLLAMTLVIGILIDDSTVVLENVERHFHMGKSTEDAAVDGRTEIGAAAVVLTLVDVVVFLPIAFLSGQVGKQLSEFGMVVAVATLSSLVVSFTVTPTLAGIWSLKSKWKPPGIVEAFDRGFDRLRDWYASRALMWGLKYPWVVLTVAFTTLIGSMALIPTGQIGEEYMPAQDLREILVELALPVGAPLTRTTAEAKRVEQALGKIPDLQAMTRVSGGYSAYFGGFVQQANTAQIELFLKPDDKKSTGYWVKYSEAVAQRLAPDASPVAVPITQPIGGNEQPVDELVSDTAGDPTPYAQKVYEAVLHTPGAVDVTSTVSALSPQIEVEFNRNAARALNVSIGDAASAVRAAFGGALPTQIEDPRGLLYVEEIYPISGQHTLQSIRDIPLRTITGNNEVHVGDIATLRWMPVPPLITRENRQTVVHVDANVAGSTSLSSLQAAIQQRIAALHLPPSVHVHPAAQGQQRYMSQTLSDMGGSLSLSIVLVFLLMVALYNSLITPFIILFAVPVAVVGALGALWLTHETLNLFSLIGSVLLVGLVAKNGILLVDYANTLRDQGMSKLEAIQESGKTRFRPIIMTTIAMVIGMAPLALSLEPGSGYRSSLGTVVIGGLTSSLVLTLVLVPIMYMRLAPEKRKQAAVEPQPSHGHGHAPA
jgi:HAE1 family hydrophobic/amphiphilic exporter-1